jgi:hypothetical protein
MLKWKAQDLSLGIGQGVPVKCEDKFYLTEKVTAKQVVTTSGNRLVRDKCVVYKAHAYSKDTDGTKIQCIPHYLTYTKMFTPESVMSELPVFVDLKVIALHRPLNIGDEVRIIDMNVPEEYINLTVNITECTSRTKYATVHNGVRIEFKRIQIKATIHDKKWLLVY